MKPFFRFLLAVTCLAFVGAALAAEDGAGVVRQMHAKYENAWFTTTQFAQKTTHYGADGTADVSMWYERMQLPETCASTSARRRTATQ